jgi:hypothetical protein
VFVCLMAFLVAVQFAYGQTQSSLTRHTRDVVQEGRARLVARLSPTETMRLVLVLPLRNQAALEQFLKELL